MSADLRPASAKHRHKGLALRQTTAKAPTTRPEHQPTHKKQTQRQSEAGSARRTPCVRKTPSPVATQQPSPHEIISMKISDKDEQSCTGAQTKCERRIPTSRLRQTPARQRLGSSTNDGKSAHNARDTNPHTRSKHNAKARQAAPYVQTTRERSHSKSRSRRCTASPLCSHAHWHHCSRPSLPHKRQGRRVAG